MDEIEIDFNCMTAESNARILEKALSIPEEIPLKLLESLFFDAHETSAKLIGAPQTFKDSTVFSSLDFPPKFYKKKKRSDVFITWVIPAMVHSLFWLHAANIFPTDHVLNLNEPPFRVGQKSYWLKNVLFL